MPRDAARDLLLGLLAFQNNFLDRAALLAAFDDWNAQPDRPLADILQDRGALGSEHLAALSTLVDLHVRRHGGDPHQSLAAVGPIGSLRDDLARLPDAGLQATLAAAPPADTSAAGDRDPTTISYDRPRDPGMRFRFLRPHAKGGLGQVSVALDEELDREVALKEIQEQHADRPDSRARFVMEAEITGKLEHPGIIPVYGMGHYADGRPYYAMRFVRGGSLKEAIDRFHGPDGPNDATARSLALRDLLDRFLDVCDAIAYAHSRGVLHRDLKPGNVMLGKFGETLVVDWGLAKPLGASSSTDGEPTIRPTRAAASDSETLAGTALGTPAYMSPEQAEGRLDLIGPRSDVYGLGATLYALLTGAAPVSGDDVGAILQRVARGEVVPPRDRDRRVPRALDAICRKAMATAPSARYADARALAADVKRWLADESVTARRDPLATRSWRWVRKHRTAATAAAAVLLVGTAALAVAWRREAAFSADLLASQAVADRRLDETLGAVKDYYTGVGEEVLLEQPQLKALRDRLLTKPRHFYEKLAAELAASGASDARSRELLGRARYDLGKILSQVGEYGPAKSEFAAAITAFDRLVAEQPDMPEHREELAKSYGSLGVAQLGTGATDDALNSIGTAIAQFERLAAARPGEPRYRHSLAASYQNFGVTQNATGATDDAITSYGKAIARFERLAADHPGDPNYRQALANSYGSLGVTQRLTGATADAIASFGKALALRERLAAEQPSVPGYRNGLAISYNDLGIAQQDTGATADAITSYGKAIARFERLAADQPGVPDYRDGLAASYSNLGDAQKATGATADAITTYGKAIARFERLAADQPGVPEYRKGLALSYYSLGQAQRDTGMTDEATASISQAIAQLGRLVDEQPGVPEYRGILAKSYNSLGTVQRITGANDDAIASFVKSIEVLRALVAAQPQVIGHQHTLGSSFYNLGLALLTDGRDHEAEAAFREGVSFEQAVFRRTPNDPEVRLYLSDCYQILAIALRAQRRGAEASEVTRERRALWPGVATQQYNVACELALCVPLVDEAGRDALGAEAMEALREAIRSGWSDAVHTAHDADLDALRGRDDFRRLLTEMFDRKFPEQSFANEAE